MNPKIFASLALSIGSVPTPTASEAGSLSPDILGTNDASNTVEEALIPSIRAQQAAGDGCPGPSHNKRESSRNRPCLSPLMAAYALAPQPRDPMGRTSSPQRASWLGAPIEPVPQRTTHNWCRVLSKPSASPGTRGQLHCREHESRTIILSRRAIGSEHSAPSRDEWHRATGPAHKEMTGGIDGRFPRRCHGASSGRRPCQ